MTTRNEQTRRSTVLCVDDEPQVLSSLDRVLRRYGCRALLADNGSDALDLLEREHVEVLICDEAMPGMCGIDVLRQAKVISPNTVRVLLTAHCSDEAVVIPAVNEGEIFRLLSKPWEDSEIRRVVADALGLEPEAWRKQQERVRERLNPEHSAPGVCDATSPPPASAAQGTDNNVGGETGMQRVWKSSCSALAVFLLIVALTGVADAQEKHDAPAPMSRSGVSITTGETVPHEIQPADVFVHAALFRDELELIRLEMGKPRNRQSEIEVVNVHPREVFFQAVTLFRKADALCFELAREQVPVPEEPAGEIRPAHVWAVVDAALNQIRRVKTKLAIPEQVRERSRDDTHIPTDVFRSIVQANRQLNLLLDRRFTPSDVFQQVTVAVSYTSRLLGRFPRATRIPMGAPFERGKRPVDVYERLLDCFGRVRTIAERSGIEIVTLSSSHTTGREVTPSDVYDLATLIVSELAYLHGRIEGIEPPQEVYDPGRKFPSHVYQRARILALQLEQLETLVDEKPNWL